MSEQLIPVSQNQSLETFFKRFCKFLFWDLSNYFWLRLRLNLLLKIKSLNIQRLFLSLYQLLLKLLLQYMFYSCQSLMYLPLILISHSLRHHQQLIRHSSKQPIIFKLPLYSWNHFHQLLNLTYSRPCLLNNSLRKTSLSIQPAELVNERKIYKRIDDVHRSCWLRSRHISFFHMVNNLHSLNLVLLLQLINLHNQQLDLVLLIHDNLFLFSHFRSFLDRDEPFHEVVLCLLNLTLEIGDSLVFEIDGDSGVVLALVFID